MAQQIRTELKNTKKSEDNVWIWVKIKTFLLFKISCVKERIIILVQKVVQIEVIIIIVLNYLKVLVQIQGWRVSKKSLILTLQIPHQRTFCWNLIIRILSVLFFWLWHFKVHVVLNDFEPFRVFAVSMFLNFLWLSLFHEPSQIPNLVIQMILKVVVELFSDSQLIVVIVKTLFWDTDYFSRLLEV